MTDAPLPTIAERADRAAEVLDRVLVPTARVVTKALATLAGVTLLIAAGAGLAAWIGRDEDPVRIAASVVAVLGAAIAWLSILQRAAVRELQHVPNHVRGLGADLPARVDQIAEAAAATETGGVLSRAGAALRVRRLCDELQGPFSDWNVLARLASPLRWTTLLAAATLAPVLLVVGVPVLLVLAL